MKAAKKLIALALAFVIVLAMGLPALAETATKNDSITVTGTKTGETYSLYKLFDLSVDSETDPSAYSYTVNSAWASFFAEGGAGAQYVTINAQGYVTAISDAAALAAAAAASPQGSALATKVADGDSVTFSGLADGYYLITSTLGTVAMTETTPDKRAATVEEKNPEDTMAKTVKEDSTGVYGEANDAQIGDTVEFKAAVNLVKGTRNVVFHDTLDDGLTFTTGSVAIEGLTAGTDYTVNESPTDGHTFDVTFTDTYLSGLASGTTTVNITYSAVLNAAVLAAATGDAAPSIVEQKNTATLTYGNASTLTSETTTTTHSFEVYKHATGKTKNLEGAVFSLKKAGTVVPLIKISDTVYRVAMPNESGAVDTFETVETGNITITGVDSDNDYSLEEITPPEGYNKLAGDVEVTVNADNDTRADIENQAGAELPSTGGIGTKIFYVIGAILVIGSAVVLITRKRMSSR